MDARPNEARRSRAGLVAATAMACILGLCSCVYRAMDPHYTDPRMRPTDMLTYYGYPAQAVRAEVRTVEEHRRYTVQRVDFASARPLFSDEEVRFDFYVQKKEGRFPTALALPISGGVDFCVESFARYLADRGFNCAIVYNRQAKIERAKTAEEVESYFRQVVIDNRQVLDWMIAHPQVDPNRIGALGLSLGGIKAAMVAGVDERVRCVVMGLAGGPLADVAVSSREKRVKDCVDALEAGGIPRSQIHEELWNKLRTDPVALSQYVDARKALMIVAVFDQSVPRATGENLRKALGGPHTVYLPTGHYTALLYLPYAHARTYRFLRQCLCEDRTTGY